MTPTCLAYYSPRFQRLSLVASALLTSLVTTVAQPTDTTFWTSATEPAFATNFFRHIDATADGRVWVGTNGQGLYLLNPETGRWKGAASAFAAQEVRSIVSDPVTGGVFVTSTRGRSRAIGAGVKLFTDTTGVPSEVWNTSRGLQSRLGYDVGVASDGSVYAAFGPAINPEARGSFARLREGSEVLDFILNYVTPGDSRDELRYFTAAEVDGRMWFAQDRNCGGSPCAPAKVTAFDPGPVARPISVLFGSDLGLPLDASAGGPDIIALEQHPNGTVFAGSNRWLAVRPPGQTRFTVLDAAFFDLDALSVQAHAIEIGADGTTYVGTTTGLLKLEAGAPTARTSWEVLADPKSLPSLNVTGIHEDADGGLYLTTGGGVAYWPANADEPDVIVEVVQTGPALVDSVSLYDTRGGGSGFVAGVGLDDADVAEFFGLDTLEGFERAIELYLWNGATGMLHGKIGFALARKDFAFGRRKEAIAIVHTDLTTYGDHPTEDDNDDWQFARYFEYPYQDRARLPCGAGGGCTPVPNPRQLYQTTLLVAPVTAELSRERPQAGTGRRPLVFVHGVTGVDGYWGDDGSETEIVDPAVDRPANGFNGKRDYNATSYVGRVAARRPDLDVWEYYYPPDQSWAESGYLFARDLPRLLNRYYTGQRASVVAHSMGGLVTRAALEGSATNYTSGGQFVEATAVTNAASDVLFLGTPHHGSLSASGIYWGRGLAPFFQQLLSGKDRSAPAQRTLSVGSAELVALSAGASSIPAGVAYLQLSGTSHKNLIPTLPGNCQPVVLESANAADGVVALPSGSLLGAGADLGLLNGFSHEHLNTPDAESDPPFASLPRYGAVVPQLISDYAGRGNLSTSLGALAGGRVFGTGDLDGPIDGSVLASELPAERGCNSEVATDVALPVVTFTDERGRPIQPLLRPGESLGYRLSATTAGTVSLERSFVSRPVGLQRDIDPNRVSETHAFTPGVYLLYGQNYAPSSVSVAAIKAAYANTSPAFFGYTSGPALGV